MSVWSWGSSSIVIRAKSENKNRSVCVWVGGSWELIGFVVDKLANFHFDRVQCVVAVLRGSF